MESVALLERPSRVALTRVRYAGALAAIAAIYFVAGKLGFLFAFATRQVTAVWPPTGVAVTALVLLGPRMWPAIAAGAFVLNATSEEPVVTAVGIAFGNTVGPLVAALLLRRTASFDAALGRVRDVLWLVLAAAMGMAVTAANGVANLSVGGIVPWSAYGSVWWVWWVGDVMGVLLFAPVLLTIAARTRIQGEGGRRLELALFATALLVVSRMVLAGKHELKYLIYPFVIWTALRFTQTATACAVLATSSVAIWAATHGRGPFVTGSLDQRLIMLEIFMAVTAVTGLVLGAMTTERRTARWALEQAQDTLEARVHERTAALATANGELVELNDQLSQRSALLGFIAEHSSDIVAVADARGIIQYISPACRRILGYEPEEIIGRVQTEFIHEEDAGRESFDRAIASGKSQYLRVFRGRRKDGTLAWLESMVSFRRHPETGAVADVLAITRDITERKAAAEALSRSEERFRTLVTFAPVAIYETDAGGNCVFVNARWSNLTGLSTEQAMGRGWAQALHPEDRERVLIAWDQCARAATEFMLDYRYRTAAGATVWVSGSAVALRSRDGALTGYLGTVVDVTERKLAADALARSEANFRSLVEQTPLGVCVSRDGVVRYVNAALVALFGYESPGQMVGRSMFDFVHGEAQELAAERRKNLEVGIRVPTSVIQCVRSDGREFLLEVSSVAMDLDGAPSLLAVVRDVTDEKRAELARTRAEAAVRDALAEKEILLQEVHHRVKNNLQVIASLVNLQAGKLQDQSARSALGEIRERVRAIALLHEKLYQSKDLAHIDMGEYIASLISDVTRMYGALAKGVHIETRVDPVRLDLETAMPCGLILNELVTNALKHAFGPLNREAPRIDVALKAFGQQLELSVADNGVGIAENTDLGESDSLGWTLVRTLSRQMQGSVRVEKETGVRCTVTFPRP